MVQFDGGIADIHDRLTIDSISSIEGLGIINLFRTGTSLINDGTIEAGTNYGLIIQQLNGGGYDLDGGSGIGAIRVTDYDAANDWGARLRLEGTHLTDSFGGRLTIGSGAEVAMNLSEGWTVDSGGEFLVGWHPDTVETARITGGALDFSGEINMLGTNGVVASDLEINSSQVRIREAARVDTSHNNVLSLGGNVTSLVRVDGGEFNVGEFGRIEFHAPTEIRGGSFQTFSSQLFDGSGGAVVFNGDTLFSGATTLGGAARQNGTATVNGLGATIHAGRFDLDGLLGDTTWNIHSSLVVNADAIDEMTNGFNGTLNIAGGFLPRLTLNLSNPSDSWSMEGEMNLSGASHLHETRVAGSSMIMAGQLNVTGGRVRIEADTIYSDAGPFGPAQVSIGPADAALRMHGNTVVHDGVVFSGDGTFVNATSGQMLFHDGVMLNDVGFENHGDFEIGELVGVAAVDRFAHTGIWAVDVGGYLAGAEHDLLLVSGMTELDGLLDVRLIDDFDMGFLPEVGDEFTILYSGGNINGSFFADPTTIAGGNLYQWSVLYNPHDVRLHLSAISAIPEPSAGLLLAGLSLLVVGYRRSSGRSGPESCTGNQSIWRKTASTVLASRNACWTGSGSPQRPLSWKLVWPMVALLAVGCKGESTQPAKQGSALLSGSASAPADKQALQPVASVAPDATPKEVAAAALLAINAKDKKTLQSLVAINKVQQDVAAITRGRAPFQGMVDKAIPSAVGSIMGEINWLDTEGREIDQETITGDMAVVTVKGQRAGKELIKRFFMVKENDLWRLVPSHR